MVDCSYSVAEGEALFHVSEPESGEPIESIVGETDTNSYEEFPWLKNPVRLGGLKRFDQLTISFVIVIKAWPTS